MSKPARGFYETILTEAVAEWLETLDAGQVPDLVGIRSAEAADRIALHLATVVERAVDAAAAIDRSSVASKR